MIASSLKNLALAGALLGILAGCNGGANNAPTNGGDAAPTGGTPTNSGTTAEAGQPGRKLGDGPGVDATGNTIKIGVVGSLTGDQKPWGEDSIKGAAMAVKEFNDAGGLNGKKVEMIQGDSGSKADQGKTATEKLLSDGVVALVGEVASGITIQMAKAAFPKVVPVIGIGATRTSLSQEGGNVFRVCYTDDFQGPVMAKFAYEDLGLRSVGVVTDNKQPYSQGLSASFAATFTKMGGKIVGESKYETGQTDFTGLVTELKNKKPDGLFLSGYFPEVGPMAQQIRQGGMADAKLLGGDGWDSPQLLVSGGQAIIGSYFCNHYNNKETRPEVGKFLTKWKSENGGKEPGTTMAALGYDAMSLTLDALKRAGKPNSKAIIEALNNTENFQAVSGTITLKG
ncbi:ethanolamine utilization protein EutJ, partial [bacterium]